MQEVTAPRRRRPGLPTLLESRGWALLSLLPWGSAACVQRSGAAATAGETSPAAAPGAVLPSSGVLFSAAAAPSGGVSLLGEAGDGGVTAFQLAGATSKVTLRTIDVQGQPFEKAIEAAVLQPGQSPWEVQLTARIQTAVQKDDALLASFFVRAEKERSISTGTPRPVAVSASPPTTLRARPWRSGCKRRAACGILATRRGAGSHSKRASRSA